MGICPILWMVIQLSANLRHCSVALLLAGINTACLFWLGPTLLNAGILAMAQLAALLLLRIYVNEH